MITRFACGESDPQNKAYWDEMRSRDYSPSFPAVKNFIRKNASRRRGPKKRNKRTVWVVALLFPLLVFFSCSRNTYTNPQGATLSFTAKDTLQTTIDYLLRQYADKEWKAVFWPRGSTLRSVISTSEKQYDRLKELAEKLKEIPGITELYLSAVKTTVKESPLSRLSYKLFNRHFNASDASDKQLRTALEAKLKETGRHDLQLTLVRENGRRQIALVPNDETHDFSLEFTLLDGSKIIAIGEKW